MAGARWLNAVDRAHLQASARELEPSHPTVAWDYGSVAPERASGAPDSLPFSRIRAVHGPILECASAVRRVRALLDPHEVDFSGRHWGRTTKWRAPFPSE